MAENRQPPYQPITSISSTQGTTCIVLSWSPYHPMILFMDMALLLQNFPILAVYETLGHCKVFFYWCWPMFKGEYKNNWRKRGFGGGSQEGEHMSYNPSRELRAPFFFLKGSRSHVWPLDYRDLDICMQTSSTGDNVCTDCCQFDALTACDFDQPLLCPFILWTVRMN